MDATSLAERALALLKKTRKIRNPMLVHTAEDVDTATGATAYEFVAVESADPNGPQHSIILDAKGSPREEVTRRNLPAHTSLPAHAITGGPSGRITIDPDTNQLTLGPGETLEETITVTIPRNAAALKADIYFLADTTGSMLGVLAAVQAGAQNILASLNGLGLDLQFGVGNYTDFPPASPLPFTHQLSPTNVAADVTAAISEWSAGGGGDFAEGQLLALERLAEPPGGAIGWRADARRIVVWFGDAPGHDPICTRISGLASDVTEASATARLVSEQIVVLAISTANPGLNADPKLAATDYTALCGAPGGAPGQATRLAAATGGAAVTGINAQTIVDTIIRLVTAAVSSLNHVELVPSATIAPFVESIAPPAGYGPLPGDAEHVLKFDVRFRGIPCSEREQVFHGTLDVVADRAGVAAKTVQITVPPCKPKTMRYSVKFVCGTQPEGCGCAPVRPGHYATHIAIHNYSGNDVRIRKSFVPIVLAGAVVGREPRVATSRAEDDITLTPHTATMDDCCRISELIFGGATSGLTVGVMEIVASADVAVTAIYTTTSSVDVEAVAGTVS